MTANQAKKIDEIQEMTPVGMPRRRVCLVVKPREATMMELKVVRPELGTLRTQLIAKKKYSFGSENASLIWLILKTLVLRRTITAQIFDESVGMMGERRETKAKEGKAKENDVLHAGTVLSGTLDGDDPLTVGEPPCVGGRVGKEPEAEKTPGEGNRTDADEEDLPLLDCEMGLGSVQNSTRDKQKGRDAEEAEEEGDVAR